MTFFKGKSNLENCCQYDYHFNFTAWKKNVFRKMPFYTGEKVK